MNSKAILALVGRKSLTWISGFCACAWAHSQWPAAFDDASFLLGLASAALLAVSGGMSYQRDKQQAEGGA